MNQQRQTAESQDLGNDYQHVQVSVRTDSTVSTYIGEDSGKVVCVCVMLQLLRGKFEGFLKQLEVGEERLQSCSDLAARLIRDKHQQSSAIRKTQQQLKYIHTNFSIC